MTPDEVLESLVDECHQDHIGLWEIVNAVQFDLGANDPTETRALTLRLVHSLLDERGMRVGHPAPEGRHFVSWELPRMRRSCGLSENGRLWGTNPILAKSLGLRAHRCRRTTK